MTEKRSPDAPHGSESRYGEGCTCSACVLGEAEREHVRRMARWEENARHMNAVRAMKRTVRRGRLQVASHQLRTGELAVLCWCGSRIVYVDPDIVQAIRTESCGARGCSEEAVA